MYVIKHNDFVENRKKYAEVCSIIHEKTGEYLAKEFGLNPVGTFQIDNATSYPFPWWDGFFICEEWRDY